MLVDQLAEDGTAPLFNADDAHRQAGHLELFANGINVGIELVLDVRAEDHDEFAVRHLFGLDEAAVRHGLVFDLGHVGGHSEDHSTEEGHAVLLELRSLPGLCPDSRAGLAVLL